MRFNAFKAAGVYVTPSAPYIWEAMVPILSFKEASFS